MSMRRYVAKCANTRNCQHKNEKKEKKLLRRWQQHTQRCLIVIESTNKKRNKNEKPVLFAYLPKQSQQVSDVRACVRVPLCAVHGVYATTRPDYSQDILRHPLPLALACSTHTHTHSIWLRFVISSARFTHAHGTHIDRLISCLSSSFFSA